VQNNLTVLQVLSLDGKGKRFVNGDGDDFEAPFAILTVSLLSAQAGQRKADDSWKRRE
jgi:hypothetical protein